MSSKQIPRGRTTLTLACAALCALIAAAITACAGAPSGTGPSGAAAQLPPHAAPPEAPANQPAQVPAEAAVAVRELARKAVLGQQLESNAIAPAAAPAAPTSGCGKALPAGVRAGATTARNFTSAGVKRVYRLHLPPGANSTTRLPLVLNFHGRSGNSADQEASSGLVAVSNREGFVIVSPDGTGALSGWAAGATPAGTVDDVRFISELLDSLERELCLDTNRYYATGFSNGAFMTSKLACVLGKRIAAIAPVAGVSWGGVPCAGPVAVLAFHGTGDTMVPMRGGPILEWTYSGALAAIATWSAQNGCTVDGAMDTIRLTDSAVREDYLGCRAATSIVVITGAGHVWPGSAPAGSPANDISAAELMWSFFATKSRAQ